MNVNVNNVKVKERWLTLQEASEITGLNIPALRQGIKRGKYSGKQLQSRNGYKWLISFDSLGLSNQSDGDRLKINNRQKSLGEQRLGEHTDGMAQILINQQGERIGEQSRHIATLENLLTVFQNRLSVVESEKDEIEGRMRLLPAPPEVVASELEEKTAALSMAENIIQQAQITQQQYEEAMEQLKVKLQEEEHAKEAFKIQWELSQAELKKPWWQKLFRR